jgi:hypothetical protein
MTNFITPSINMSKIFSSASKIVFLLVALTACVGFFIGKLEAKDFMVLSCMAFSFYFANKGETKTTEPYAGK